MPSRLTGGPKYEDYRTPGLPAAHPQEGVESLAGAVERLRSAVGRGRPASYRPR
ncbi:hypothetical protein OIE50_47670 [Streptomyces canus]